MLILIVLSTVESVLTSINLGFSVEASAGLRASVGFNPFSSVLTPIGRPFEVKLVGTFKMFVRLRNESRESMSVSPPVSGLDT